MCTNSAVQLGLLVNDIPDKTATGMSERRRSLLVVRRRYVSSRELDDVDGARATPRQWLSWRTWGKANWLKRLGAMVAVAMPVRDFAK